MCARFSLDVGALRHLLTYTDKYAIKNTEEERAKKVRPEAALTRFPQIWRAWYQDCYFVTSVTFMQIFSRHNRVNCAGVSSIYA